MQTNETSKSTLKTEEPKSARQLKRKKDEGIRKMSLEEFQKSSDRLFGVFNLQEYKILRGFIPGRGKRVRLHYSKFEPAFKVASICIVHGYGEQSDDYLQIADHFARNRFVVHMIDMRGFGYSGGHRMQDCLQELFHDIEVLLKCCELNLPAYIMASGLGAMITLNLLIENPGLPFNGVVIMTPNISFPLKEMTLFQAIIKRFCRAYMGEFLVNSHVNPTAVTKRTDILQKNINEGVNYQYIRLSTLEEVQQATTKLVSTAKKFSYPVLMYVGAENSLQPVKTVQKLFEDFSSKDKSLRIFPHGYHSLHLDEECEEIKKESLRWMIQRLGKSKFTKLPFVIRPGYFSKAKFSWLKMILWAAVAYGLVKLVKWLIKLKIIK